MCIITITSSLLISFPPVHCLVMSSEIRILQVQSVEFRILWKVHLSSYTGQLKLYLDKYVLFSV